MLQSMRGVVLIVALMLSGGAAAAAEDSYSAQYLIEACRNQAYEKATGDIFKKGMCLGTVRTLWNRGSGCSPKSVTVGQVIKVVVAYIDQRPTRLHESFISLTTEALEAAWPCQR